MCESVFFARVSRDVVFASTAGIYKFNFYVFADTFQMAIAPQLPSIGSGEATALLGRTFVGAATRMRLDLIGRPK